MKLIRYGKSGEEKPGLIDSENSIRDLSGVVSDIDGVTLNAETLDKLKKIDVSTLAIVEGDARLAEPVAKVGKFICVGLNYIDHAEESGMAVPNEPVLFSKATSCICGPNDDIVLPPGAEKADWEVELGIVIGKEAKYVDESEAMDYVAGICLVNDLSERSFQMEREGQWMKGKSSDTFGPFGPYLVTLDDVDDFNKLGIWLELNGKRIQNSNTSKMIFKLPYLVSYISQFMTLQAGDLISTGTPPGVGFGMKPQLWLKEGDVIRAGIDGLGEQQQTVTLYGR